jgi:hypothetical protein
MTGVVSWWSLVCSRCASYILPIPLYGLTAVPQALFLITVFSGALLTHSFLRILLLCPHLYLALTLKHALSRRPVKVSASVRLDGGRGGGASTKDTAQLFRALPREHGSPVFPLPLSVHAAASSLPPCLCSVYSHCTTARLSLVYVVYRLLLLSATLSLLLSSSKAVLPPPLISPFIHSFIALKYIQYNANNSIFALPSLLGL